MSGGSHFTPTQKKELHYAALLHDFGKVSVREDVLLKKEKLYPVQLERLRHWFLFASELPRLSCCERNWSFCWPSESTPTVRGRQQADVRFQKYLTELDALWE